MDMKLAMTGCNTSQTLSGRSFHVQTEDSGKERPHVITHLFTDGGRIVATRRTSYEEEIGAPSWVELVRFLIKFQHKTMLQALGSGAYATQIAATNNPAPIHEPPLDLEAVKSTLTRAEARRAERAAPPPPPPPATATSLDLAARARSVTQARDRLGPLRFEATFVDDLNEIILEDLALGAVRAG